MSENELNDLWEGTRVFITGVCGTVGRELLNQLAQKNVEEIVGIDHNESELFFVKEAYRHDSRVKLYLADVRDPGPIDQHTRRMDVIIHAAALKHVILCEESPREPVQANVIGTQNVIDAASANDVKRVIFTSSDKAVNPTNVMGTSKLMGERLMTAANSVDRNGYPIFASTRFGNVLGSRGSVIPVFKRQIAHGGPVTVTDERMTRFVMTLDEAVNLVLRSVFLAQGGEVFVTKMSAVRIRDLAEAMVRETSPNGSIPIKIVGSKPGEKLYEELINDEEARRTVELDDYYAVLPAFRAIYRQVDYVYSDNQREAELGNGYSSANVSPVCRESLREYLRTHRLV